MQTEEPKIKVKVISKTPKDIYVALAKKAIKRYLNNDSIRNSEIPAELFRTKAGCFVSLHLKINNELRGCIGT
ncbi:MAG: AMMECR1 domain-containing protein, partial [bacterium]|nr:AMMECR1 domain-containing protein [bacterium]